MKYALTLLIGCALVTLATADTILVEAEGFKDHGGWKLDTQFIETMGSPYLIAHGLGVPVSDASTTMEVPSAGTYRVWVRTKDWVAHWKAPGQPGRFEVSVNGNRLEETFGTKGADWFWHEGGSIELSKGDATLALKDLTGFNGRCDAILFSSDPAFEPDNTSDILPTWRRKMLGVEENVIDESGYDLVVVGGGYAGLGAAISAARMGCKVALIQNRGVLGGNGSSEIRVWANGNMPGWLYPIGDIIREIEDDAKKSPGTAREFEDDKKEAVVRAERNISLFLHHHAHEVEMDGKRIKSVLALDTRSNQVRRFAGRFFVDCTGHGTIGLKAGADYTMEEGGRMGMSNMWAWEMTESSQSFPEVPWALELGQEDFPYPNKFHAPWFWESGFDKHPLNDLETIRDWNLRAGFGAWNAIKHKGAYDRYDKSGNKHANARLTWMAYVGGTRETLQLLGDVVLQQEHILSGKKWPDGAVLTTWGIDLHYPREQYAKKYPDNPFISRAEFGKKWDTKNGYPVPYRCFYSRNIENLFMAGRNVSVSHRALGTVRVMKTLGMMGVVVGRAAAVGTIHDCSPREVYTKHLDLLIELMKVPGRAHRATVHGGFIVPPAKPVASGGKGVGIPLGNVPGLVIDNEKAVLKGNWITSTYHSGFVHKDYIHDDESGKGSKSVTYRFRVPTSGDYEVRFAFRYGSSRAAAVPVTVTSREGERSLKVNQQKKPEFPHDFASLGTYAFETGKDYSVVVSNEGTTGHVIADAVQVLATSQ